MYFKYIFVSKANFNKIKFWHLLWSGAKLLYAINKTSCSKYLKFLSIWYYLQSNTKANSKTKQFRNQTHTLLSTEGDYCNHNPLCLKEFTKRVNTEIYQMNYKEGNICIIHLHKMKNIFTCLLPLSKLPFILNCIYTYTQLCKNIFRTHMMYIIMYL